ncbi:MAG TPA: SCO1664 family protein [Propionibacteriaceae bacterium]|nr:SCO1664 family protein [Propionibacteriaceae bacterium]
MPPDELTVLQAGEIDLVGRVVDSSNATYVVQVTLDGEELPAVYKPQAGERPLWDFDPGLYKRERAAYLLSDHLGWGLVPPTVVREDAPAGVGSLQRFVEGDQREHYFSLYDARPELHDTFRRLALFDCIANNTDRKSGHVLLGDDGHVYGIDHGLCFAADFKLRTVIWDFAGDAIPDEDLAAIEPLATSVPRILSALLSRDEVEALQLRVRRLLATRVLPVDTTGRRVPWPLV